MEHKDGVVKTEVADASAAAPPPPPQTKYLFGNISGGFSGGGVEPARLNPGRKMPPNSPTISFTAADFIGNGPEREALPMVISVEIRDFTVRKVLVLESSNADILYWSTFQKLGLPASMMKPYSGNLTDIFGSKTEIKGYVDLKTAFGEGEHADSINIRYLVIDANMPCNAIIGWPTLKLLRALISVAHLTIKYPRPDGKVGVIKADIEMARECFKEGL